MTFKNDTEIKHVEDWHFIWWDLDKDVEFIGSITGTPWNPLPRIERRYVQNIYGKQVHVLDDGELEIIDGECGYMQARLRCKTCGKEFCADY